MPRTIIRLIHNKNIIAILYNEKEQGLRFKYHHLLIIKYNLW